MEEGHHRPLKNLKEYSAPFEITIGYYTLSKKSKD